MRLTVEPLDDSTWPGVLTPNGDRQPSRFKSSWSTIMAELDREVDLTANGGRYHAQAVLEVPFPRTRIYRDGTGVHADAAAPRHPGVALSFDIDGVGPVRFATDRYRYGGPGYTRDWQANVRAIVLTLEALRGVDRWGAVRSAQQYRGWQAIGAGDDSPTAMGSGLTVDAAARLLADAAAASFGEAWCSAEDLLHADDRADLIRGAYRDAAKRAHPDAGGDPEEFRRLTEARDLLLAHG